MTRGPLSASKRRFLRFLAASPLLCAHRGALGAALADPYAPQAVARAADALNVFDLREAARRALTPAHYTYLALGTDGGGTLRANRDGFENYQLRMRRLVRVEEIDMSMQLFGESCPLPLLLAPCGSQGAFHPEGEIVAARAARSRGVVQMLSTVSSSPLEAVNEARGRPVWFQLYPSADWQTTRALVKRAESAGCPVLVLTVDIPDTNREVMARFRRDSNPECQPCHGTGPGALPPKPMAGDMTLDTAFMDWDFVDRLKDQTSMKLCLKGIVTAEDAQLAVEHGVDALVVSNHGGRSEDSGRSTIECLPEVVNAVAGRIPVIVDSGFRRGTDIFKALALGADAVAIGRPYLWGLGAFGQEGVETAIDLLQRELQIIMRQAGTPTLAQITRSCIA
jgi:isopentenyl diphosphate isomerase/L-lactate dehydrogenase-like FMN-dependent dehydrogenase